MSVSRRTSARVAAGLLLLWAVFAFIWPLHAWVASYQPVVFGLPFSLAWVVHGQLVVFVGLLLLFLNRD